MSAQTIIPPVKNVGVTTLPYAGFWRRFIAWSIDRTIIDFCVFLLLAPLLFASTVGGMMAFPMLVPFGGFAGFNLMGLWLLADWLYFTGFESSASGATLGKKLMGLRVTDLNARQIGFGRASLRYIGKVVSTLILFLGYFLVFFTDKRQALHDLAAETIVIRTK